MMTIDGSQWDETICNMIACQHPPCWEALRRIERGVPRILLTIPGRDSPESGDELPTLKIVNLPFNYSQKGRIRCNESLSSISKTISNIRNTRSFYSSSTLNEALLPPVSVLSSEKNLAPGMNSRVESRTPYYTPIGFSFWRQAEEVSDLGMFVDPSLDQQTHQPSLVVRWVPGTRHKLLQPENPATNIGTPTQRICVKDLALESLLSLTEKQEIKRKKSSKVPTGGQPYLLHLKKNQKVPNGRSSNPTGKETYQNVSPSRKRQYPPNRLQLQSESALDLENRKGMLTESKEKLVLPFIVQKAPSLNKFDAKIIMKGKGLRKTQSKQEAALGGLDVKFSLCLGGSVLLRCPVPNQVQPLDDPALLSQLSPSAFAENGLQSEVSAPLATSKGKTSVKFVEYRSSKGDLTMEGYDSSVHQISRSKTNYNMYCKITAKQKGAMLTQDICWASSREQWPKGAAQKSEEGLLSPNPPPPPPSPLPPEISENSFPDLT